LKLLNLVLFFYILIPSCIRARAAEINPVVFSNKVNSAAFEENLGQIKYPDDKPAPEVKYVFKQGNLKIFLLKTGLAYQLEKYEQDTNQVTQLSESASVDSESFFNNTIPKRIQTYRMDMQLIGANPNPEIITEGKSEDYNNYYKPDLIQTHYYQKIIYKNIYPGIDWVIYLSPPSQSELAPRHSELDSESIRGSKKMLEQVQHEGVIKYDFIVHPGADPALIKLKYKNAELIYLDKDGNLILRNRLGDIRENAPIAFQELNDIPVRFLQKDNIVSFDIKEYDKKQTLIIDPKLEWSTYYGGAMDDASNGLIYHNDENIYIYGQTRSSSQIAYNGFQDNLISSANSGMLVKFDKKGRRIWGTYYGNNIGFYGGCIDKNENIVLVGTASDSTTNYTLNGHQNSYAGGTSDGILVKFNNSGARIWASYYGGSAADHIFYCKVDSTNSIYIFGITHSINGISHNGYQNTFRMKLTTSGLVQSNFYLAKFYENGSRVWGTYHGVGSVNYWCVFTILNNFIYLGTILSDTTSMFTSPYTFNSMINRIRCLTKFDIGGTRIFSKQIFQNFDQFNSGNEINFFSNSKDIYCSTIVTNSILPNPPPPLLSSGFKTNVTGNSDILIAKFDTLGNEIWKTYCGGNMGEGSANLCFDKHENMYIAGNTFSNSNIFFKGINANYSGAADVFLTKVSKNGGIIWSSYFGGNQNESPTGVVVDSNDQLYMAGHSRSKFGFGYKGMRDTNDNGLILDAFLMKISCSFYDTIRDTICIGDSFYYKNKYFTKAGYFTDSFLTWDICDSFITLQLTVLRKDSTHIYDTLCNNLPKSFNGQSLTLAGIYRDTLQNTVGCDSHIFYHFIPKPIYETPLSRAICASDSALFGGKYYKLAGVYYDTLKTKRNCDSVLKLTLIINPLDTNRQTQSICRGKSYNFYSQVLTTAGTYSHKFNNRNGCDSLILMTISVIDSSTYSFSRMLCSGQSFPFNNQNLTQAGVYRDTFMNYLGCDSFVTLNLSFGLVLYDTLRQTVCAGQSFRGYTSSGTYYETYKSNLGCDSILTIYLKHLPTTEYKTIQHSKCGAFRYGSSTYTQNDSFTETVKNYLNCDSIVTKHLVFITEPQPKFLADKTIEFCEEMIHKGQRKTTSFFTQDTVKSLEFPYCDSLYQPYYYRRENRPVLTAISKQIDTVIKGETTNIQVSGAQNYRWATGEQSSAIRPQINEDKTFEVTTWNLADCEEKMQFSIYVIDQPLIDFPTAYSPNGDGLNDYFTPDTDGNITIDYFQIYNRWGEKVYEHSSLSKGWDGTFLGKPAANGLYTYTLRFSYLGRSFTKSGEVMMVR
jgi:gliding motility-associated-like protein